MKKYKNLSIEKYLNLVSTKEPVPGGGSVSAMVGAFGASLLCMVANYSIGKSQSKSVEKKILRILSECKMVKEKLLNLADLDAKAYLKIVKARKGSVLEKKKALKETKKVSKEICSLCYKTVKLAPYLAEKGNPQLLGDVEAAVEILLASFNSSLYFFKG